MQVIAISAQPDLRAKQLLEQHHRLRARVFSDRLGWAVCVLDGLESDAFDDLEPTYIIRCLGQRPGRRMRQAPSGNRPNNGG